ncbi:MAG: Sir2 family NAD-dependent protein deacetylase, partial [Flavobacteriales bacterium]|nr:Sir2 family NAD-dependent protein deacetylase [Flavobacteriales bacterium]
MQRIVVFTGAGISAESGLGTFRDSGGLWEQYKIEDVATPEAFDKNPELVLNFYNLRRKQLLDSKPNVAHFALNQLSEKYYLNIITQNIDDLHERSGNKKVLHLHGK